MCQGVPDVGFHQQHCTLTGQLCGPGGENITSKQNKDFFA